MKKYAIIIFILTIMLVLFGSYLVMSASSTYSAFKLSDEFGLFNDHIWKVGLGIGIIIAFAAFPYTFYRDHSMKFIIGALILLLITVMIGVEDKGSSRAISVFFFRFQPSALAALAMYIHLAALIESKGALLTEFRDGFVYILFWILLTGGLVFIQPNVSSASLLVFIGFIILFIAGAKLRHILASAGSALTLAGIVAMILPHSRSRILSYFTGVNSGGEINIQVKQALIGLGSGGWFGVGFGHSNQRNLFLPEAWGDFIFAILGEETGLIGTSFVLGVYLLIFLLGIIIAKNTKDLFGQLLAAAISISFVMYAFVHAGVVTGLLPTTGLTLPLISHGGTSILINCMAIGILINIGITNSKYELVNEAQPAL